MLPQSLTISSIFFTTIHPKDNLISNLALSYGYVRQYRASEQMFHRLMELAPDLSMIKVQKASVVDFNERGDTGAVESALAELPKSQTEDREALSLQLAFAISREEWPRAKELIERIDEGDDEGEFGYGNVPVPVRCYSILLAALHAVPITPAFAETREQLSNRALRSPANERNDCPRLRSSELPKYCALSELFAVSAGLQQRRQKKSQLQDFQPLNSRVRLVEDSR